MLTLYFYLLTIQKSCNKIDHLFLHIHPMVELLNCRQHLLISWVTRVGLDMKFLQDKLLEVNVVQHIDLVPKS